MYTNNNDYEENNDYHDYKFGKFNNNDENNDNNIENDISIDDDFYKYSNLQDENSADKNPKKSKKLIILIVVILIVLLLIGGLLFYFLKVRDNNGGNNGGEVIQPSLTPEVVLKTTTLNLKVGDSAKIEYTIENDNSNVIIKWGSQDEKIATVDENGTVKGVKAGTVDIVASYTIDSQEYEKICSVTISKTSSSQKNPSVTLKTTSLNLQVNESGKIDYKIENDNGKVTITWKSNNTSIATVDKNGTVKGVKAGTTQIVGTYTINGKTEKKTCSVTVTAVAQTPTVTLKTTSLSLKVGESSKIQVENSSNVAITWTSNNPSIATVDKNGTVKGVKAGTTQIVATYTINGKTDQKTCSVTVTSSSTTTPVVDKTPPIVTTTITSGKENTWVNTNVVIKVSATDSSGIKNIKYKTSTNGTYQTVTNNIITISTSGTNTVYILVTDNAGNETPKSVNVKIDKTKPKCSLEVSETGVLTSKSSDTGGSDLSYNGFSSTYTGSVTTAKTLTSAGTYTYYVKDKAGNTDSCSIVVKTKTQYRYQDCTSCKSCEDAGIEYGWTLTNSGCSSNYSSSGYWSSGNYYKRECYNTDKECSGNASAPRKCYTYKRYTIGNNSSCEKCGCATWGTFSTWSNTVYMQITNKRNVETKTVYYRE